MNGPTTDSRDLHCDLVVDFSFLANQTFGDPDLEREILGLFMSQLRIILPKLSEMSEREQNDAAHRLRGSCQGIGAHRAAAAAQAYEDAKGSTRAAAHAHLIESFADTEAAILVHMMGR